MTEHPRDDDLAIPCVAVTTLYDRSLQVSALIVHLDDGRAVSIEAIPEIGVPGVRVRLYHDDEREPETVWRSDAA